MLDELRKNASSDKEFIQMELKKRIAELEAEIERLKAEHAEDKEKLMDEQRKVVKEFE